MPKTDPVTVIDSDGGEWCVCRDIRVLEDACGDKHDGYVCTREPGHDGPHVACGGDVHRMDEWGGVDA